MDIHTDPIVELCKVCTGLCTDEKGVLVHARALARIGSEDLSPAMQDRLIDLCDGLLESHRMVISISTGRIDWKKLHLEGRPSLAQWMSHRTTTSEALLQLWQRLSAIPARPDGFTVSDLMGHADIKEYLWTKIRNRAGVDISRGQSARKLTNAEIKRLIKAAMQHKTPKSIAAAKSWQALLVR